MAKTKGSKDTSIPQKGENPAMQNFKPKPIKLVIGTPCYGGMVNEGYLQSMFDFTSQSTARGMQVMLITMANESLITRGRNEIVNMFMRTPDATHLMFIDADITFKSQYILDMLAADKDVIAGSYPLKTINWEGIKQMQDSMNGEASVEQLKKASVHTVINVTRPDQDLVNQQQTVQVVNGLVEVYDAGTGFMLIKREVIEKMQNAYPETMYYSDKDFSLDLAERKRYALFDTMIDQDGRYLSEDYTFCRRWQGLAGKIYVDIRAVLNHTGTHTFAGAPLVTKLPS